MEEAAGRELFDVILEKQAIEEPRAGSDAAARRLDVWASRSPARRVTSRASLAFRRARDRGTSLSASRSGREPSRDRRRRDDSSSTVCRRTDRPTRAKR